MGCGASKSKKTKPARDPQPAPSKAQGTSDSAVDSSPTGTSTGPSSPAGKGSHKDDTGNLAKADTDTGTTSPPVSSPELPGAGAGGPSGAARSRTTTGPAGGKGAGTDPQLPLSPLRPLDTVHRTGPTQLQPLSASPAVTGAPAAAGTRTPLGAIGASRPLRPSPLSGITTTSPPKDGKKEDGSGDTADGDTSLSPDAWSRARQRRRSIGGPLSNPLLSQSMQADSVHGGQDRAGILARVSSDAVVPSHQDSSGEPGIPSPKHRTHEHHGGHPPTGASSNNAALARLGRIEHTGYGDIDGIGGIQPRTALAPIAR
eukprot:TRINITY_DN32904_c0_g1_i1.p1 TRINITY_DN32904_c0_g1~~TRINITY_DN32904_c0_g1_i1.p1  ORF type:complete len:315 (+),score=39.87 TRINITY_DN32904_c0_g1_i1:535-1479(+)